MIEGAGGTEARGKGRVGTGASEELWTGGSEEDADTVADGAGGIVFAREVVSGVELADSLMGALLVALTSAEIEDEVEDEDEDKAGEDEADDEADDGADTTDRAAASANGAAIGVEATVGGLAALGGKGTLITEDFEEGLEERVDASVGGLSFSALKDNPAGRALADEFGEVELASSSFSSTSDAKNLESISRRSFRSSALEESPEIAFF